MFFAIKLEVSKIARKKKKLIDNFTRILLSTVIFILLGANFIFIASWVIHELQILSVEDNSKVTVFHSISAQEQNTRLKVEVFNACGVKNVAKMMTDFLRDNNVDVVYYGNYLVNNRIYSIHKTLVIDRKHENRRSARRIAKMIDVKEKYVIHQLSPEREVDVTILIGKDYNALKAFR